MQAWRAGVGAAHAGDCVAGYLREHPPVVDRLPRTLVVATGKAAVPMAAALGPTARGLALAPHGTPAAGLPPHIQLLEGAHPLPDESGIASSRAILDAVAALTADDHLLYLVSGGSSALFEVPDPRVSAAEVRATYDALVRCGADIAEINSVRRALSAVKGGRLAAAARPASVLTLAVSDVAGDDPATIGSGPTVACPPVSGAARDGREPAGEIDARAVIGRYALEAALPRAVLDTLARPVACGPLRTEGFTVVASAETARAAAACELAARGYRCVPPPVDRLTGATAAAASVLARAIQTLTTRAGKHAFAVAGETTVRVPDGAGTGGRNQHLAALLACRLRGLAGFAAVFAGTDGRDGNSSAAGALVDGGSAGRADDAGRPLRAALESFDSAGALAAAGDALVTGATGTNVEDLVVVVTEAS